MTVVVPAACSCVGLRSGAADWGNKELLSDEILKDLVEQLSEVSLGNQVASADVLGDAYEYLIGPISSRGSRSC